MPNSNNLCPDQQMWIELAPHSGRPPSRLLVFLHGAGSSPEVFTPLALAWQFKFPGAAAIVMQGLIPGSTGQGKDWFVSTGTLEEQAQSAAQAGREVVRRIAIAQQAMNLDPASTALIGFSQGAVMALEVARQERTGASIVVAHAGRLLRPITAGVSVSPAIHLLHGELDSLVLARHSLRAFRALRAAGTQVSLDIVTDGIHSIGQDMVNVGTSRVMQTIFAQRKRIDLEQYRARLTVSLDNQDSDAAWAAASYQSSVRH